MDYGFNPAPKPEFKRRNKPDTKLRKRKPKENGDLTKEQVRTEVKKRDGNWCLLSGKPGPGLHLHRVVYSGMGGGGGKYETSNCVLLSDSMHRLVHSNKRVWMPLLQDYLQCKAEGSDPTKTLNELRYLAKLSGW